MQLKHIPGLRPLTITSFIIANSLSSFAYNDLDQYSNFNIIVSNTVTAKYIQEAEVDSYSELLLKTSFQEHLSKWQSKTKFCSSVKQIINDQDFKSIVEMGKDAVPFIKIELERKPSFLVWALNLIYSQKITNNPDTTIEEASKQWVKKLNS